MTRIGICLCLVIALATDGLAQKSPAKNPAKNPANAKSPTNPKSPVKRSRAGASKRRAQLGKVQIKQAFAFAKAHHPELAKLIGRLQSAGNRAAYHKAITELSRTARRLEPIKTANPERYEMMVELWKLGSQARLMVARSMMKPDPKRDALLRETLRKRAELRRIMLLADFKRSQARIDRIQAQLKLLENLDAATDRELQRLKRSARIAVTRTKGRSGKQPKTVVPVKAGTGKPGKPSKTTVKTTVKTKDNSKP